MGSLKLKPSGHYPETLSLPVPTNRSSAGAWRPVDLYSALNRRIIESLRESARLPQSGVDCRCSARNNQPGFDECPTKLEDEERQIMDCGQSRSVSCSCSLRFRPTPSRIISKNPLSWSAKGI